MKLSEPKLNLETIVDIEVGSDEWLHGLMQATEVYFQHSIIYALSLAEAGRRKGTNDSPTSKQQVIEYGCFGLLQQENESLYNMMMNKGEDGKLLGDRLFGMALRELVDNNVVIYHEEDGGITLNTNLDLEPEDTITDQELDGVSYPLVSEFSPVDIMFYSEHEQIFRENFPQGNYNKILASAQHLLKQQVEYFSQETAGKTMWMYSVVEQFSSDDDEDVLPEGNTFAQNLLLILKKVLGNRNTFTLTEVYEVAGSVLQQYYPNNSTIEASIRANLQNLRDNNDLRFTEERGVYAW